MISVNDINNFEQTIERKDRIIEVLKKAVRQWVKEYNILDEIIEMYKMSENEAKEIIAELKADNHHLNDLLDNALNEQEELREENKRLKEEIKVLQYNIAEYSNNNIDTAVTLFAKDKAKLEEENALLKAYKNKYYQQTLDDEIKLNELYQVLQEIKKICKMDCGECQYNQDCDCNFEECEEAKIDDILDLITKAEEE